MTFLKRVMEKIFDGILYGIGISLVLFAASFVISEVLFSPLMEPEEGVFAECSEFEDCPEEAGLFLEITGERISSEDFVLLGNVENQSEYDWDSVRVKAEIFDTSGNFIDECSETLDQKLVAGATSNFKLSCGSCKKVNLDDYGSYKAVIIDADNW